MCFLSQDLSDHTYVEIEISPLHCDPITLVLEIYSLHKTSGQYEAIEELGASDLWFQPSKTLLSCPRAASLKDNLVYV